MATIAVLGTFDTKSDEHAFVAGLITSRGHKPLFIDVGTKGKSRIKPDVSRSAVARAGGSTMKEIKEKNDRGHAVMVMSQGAPEIVKKFAEKNRIQGIISLGGGGGTSICTAAMRALPIGFPKLMVSTLASGDVSHYVGVKDVVMMPSIVDVAGLNRISRMILANAASAICGMVETEPPSANDKPLIVASMFGNTTDCVSRARIVLEKAGYEVLVFHATGAGGRTMESLIESGMVAGVLDVTTTEWADELLGGVLSAGPTRLEAAAKNGVPAVVGPGCLDMVNFGPPETIPEKFQHRNFYQHNPQVTLMRTSAEECADLGQAIGEKLSLSKGPVTFMIPRSGVSVISAANQRFHDPIADQVLFQAIRAYLRDDIPVKELPNEINDQSFAEACANELLENIAKAKYT
tara:strand:+ start:979 stop:2196 length:1218 start_codon:yes stop_codon:yes gene_type:complete